MIDRFAGFLLTGELGRGADSVVYRATREADGLDYALKIRDAGPGEVERGLKALSREAALLASVVHPDLPRVYEVGDVDGRPYLVTGLVEGRALSDVLEAGPLSPDDVVRLASDLCPPLGAVHRSGLVHRDIKPHNIMILPDGQARLIDFGLASHGRREAGDLAAGTFAYCPPEQSGLLRRPVDARSDLYSLGVVLFECLAGELPFASHDVGDLLRMHAIAPPPDLRALAPHVPTELAEIVARLLAKDPDDRFTGADDLAGALYRVGGRPRDASVDADPAPPGRGAEWALAVGRWESARAGHGGVCLLRGASGVGKSRLAERVAEQARRDGALVLGGKSSPGDTMPFAPLREGLDRWLGAVGRLADDERDLLHRQIRDAAGDDAPLLRVLSARLQDVLGSQGPSPEASQDRFASAATAFLLTLAGESGLLIRLDDVQWLDPGTHLVLRQLASELRRRPVLVVGTARDDAQSQPATDALLAALGDAVDTDIALRPLDRAGLTELVRSVLPGMPLRSRLVDLLEVRGSGNPFLVLEYVRAIADAGLLRPSWGEWVLDEAGMDELELPDDAFGLILARVRELGDDVRQVLVTAAAMGNRFDPATLADVSGGDERAVLDALGDAAGHRLIEPRDHGHYAFLHDRIREALADQLQPSQAAALHLRIAETLDESLDRHAGTDEGAPDVVFAAANHYLLAGTTGASTDGGSPDRVMAACRAAGRQALAAYAPAEAVRYLRHAAGLGVPLDADFLDLLGAALQQDGQWAEAIERFHQALERHTDPLDRAATLARIAESNRSIWREAGVIEATRRGLIELGAPVPSGRARRLLVTLALFTRLVFLPHAARRAGATERERRRWELIALMHDISSYQWITGHRPMIALMHTVHSLHWANRIGEGEQYARSQATFGCVIGLLRLRRTSDRAFAAADRATRDPVTKASTAYARAALAYLGGVDDGEQWAQVLQRHHRSLDLAALCDAACALRMTALYRGHRNQAEEYTQLAERRLALGTPRTTALIAIPPLALSLEGRHAEAARAIETMTALYEAEPSGYAHIVARALVSIFALYEQGELGAPFDAAAEPLEALPIKPGLLLRPQRLIYVVLANGRLAQARAATGVDRARRLAQVDRALSLVAAAADSAELRDRLTIARAERARLTGAPKTALRLLSSRSPVPPVDSPTATFEAALVAARALRDSSADHEAQRQAMFAAVLADRHDWPHRAASVRREFALGARSDSGPGDRPARSDSAPDGRTSGYHGSAPYGGVPLALERQRLQALQQVSLAASQVLDPDAIARIALDEILRILQADRAFLFLQEPDGNLLPHLGRDAGGTDLEQLTGYSATLVARVHQSGEPLVVTGTEEGAALGAQSVVVHGLRSVMVSPVMIDGRSLGVVYLDSQVAKGIFSTGDISILTALTTHIATRLETARAAQLEISVQTAQRQRDLAEALRAALERMTDTLEPQAVFQRLLETVPTVVPCSQATIVPPNADVADGLPPAPDGEPSTSSSWVRLPLRNRGVDLGTLVLAPDPADPRLADDIEVVQALAAQAMTAYDNASMFAEIRRLAVIDELTGIANRRHLLDLGEQALADSRRSGTTLAVIMLDIDHFKRVNDSHGHPTGDDVIREVAARLTRRLRAGDIAGRYGGEEFALVLPGAPPDCDLPEQIRHMIGDLPILTRTGPLAVTVSIGVTWHRDGESLSDLLARADHALYQAKTSGRNRVHAA